MKENSKEAYYYGSEAPQRNYEASPVRVPRRQTMSDEEIRRHNRRVQAQANQRSATRFGPLYTAIIIGAVIAMGLSCVNYIKAMNAHTANTKTIDRLETEITEAKQYNIDRKLAIDTSIDYEYIYRVAVKDLGMIYPLEGQIVKYESGECEYVNQYSDFK